MKHLYFLLLGSCLLMACSSTKKLTNKQTVREQIRFGHGGGFTGAVTEYCLINNGELYKKAFGEISKMEVSKKESDSCFIKCEVIEFQKIQLNSPGNRYAFISHHRNDSIHRITWNPHQPDLSLELIEFHNSLLALVGEEPMTIIPEEKATIEQGKVLKKRSVIDQLQPVKKKSDSNSKKQLIKKIDLKKKNPKKM